jgi:hypothetical protein
MVDHALYPSAKIDVTFVSGDICDATEHNIVHCISADTRQNSWYTHGVAKDIEAKFYVRGQLSGTRLIAGQVMSIDNDVPGKTIHHLITKHRTVKGQHVPLGNVPDASEKLECEEVAMPLIGCGLDKNNARDLIQELVYLDCKVKRVIIYLGFERTVPGYPEVYVHQPVMTHTRKQEIPRKKPVKTKREVVYQAVAENQFYFYFENCNVTATVAHANHSAEHLINKRQYGRLEWWSFSKTSTIQYVYDYIKQGRKHTETINMTN